MEVFYTVLVALTIICFPFILGIASNLLQLLSELVICIVTVIVDAWKDLINKWFGGR